MLSLATLFVSKLPSPSAVHLSAPPVAHYQQNTIQKPRLRNKKSRSGVSRKCKAELYMLDLVEECCDGVKDVGNELYHAYSALDKAITK